MSAPVLTDMVQLPRDDAGPVFDRPWQAQAFALTVELYKSDLFTWPEWVEVFSEEIKAFPILPGESVNDAYYRQWMSALEKMVASRKLVEETDLLARTQEWRQAYLNTPMASRSCSSTQAALPGMPMMTTMTNITMMVAITTTIIMQPNVVPLRSAPPSPTDPNKEL